MCPLLCEYAHQMWSCTCLVSIEARRLEILVPIKSQSLDFFTQTTLMPYRSTTHSGSSLRAKISCPKIQPSLVSVSCTALPGCCLRSSSIHHVWRCVLVCLTGDIAVRPTIAQGARPVGGISFTASWDLSKSRIQLPNEYSEQLPPSRKDDAGGPDDKRQKLSDDRPRPTKSEASTSLEGIQTSLRAARYDADSPAMARPSSLSGKRIARSCRSEK